MNRPGPLPPKSQQDAFMEDLLEGLSPSDLIPSSPIEQKKLSQTQRICLSETRNTKTLFTSQNDPKDLSIADAKFQKKLDKSSSPKRVLQASNMKRQGSLMQCNNTYPDVQSIDLTRGTHSKNSLQKASNLSKDESYCQPTRRDTINKDAFHRTGTRGVSSSPLSTHKLAKSLAKLSPEKASLSKDSPAHAAVHHEDYDALFMDLEDGWDDFVEDENESRIPNPKLPLCRQYTKCIVSQIMTPPEWNPSNKRMERTIEVTINSSKDYDETKRLLLCDDWAESLIELNDELNLVSLPDSPPIQLDQELITFSRSEPGHLIILIPSVLINTTAVSTAPSCPRRGVLNDRIKSSHNDIGEAVIRGTIVHEVIQSLLLPSEDMKTEDAYRQTPNHAQELWPMTKILKEARKACVRHVGDLLMINQTVDQGFSMVSDHLKELPSWSKKYILQKNEGKNFKLQKDAHLFDPRSNVRQDEARPKIALTAIHDIEEEIWSPKYGLKGKIDATVEAAIIEEPMKVGFFFNKELFTQECNIFPLEIKTGRKPNGVEHTAQTMLYTLLMSDRYNQNVPAGLLFYTSINEITRVRAVNAELRQLIIARNHLASYIHKRAIDSEAVPITPTQSSITDGMPLSPHFDGDLPVMDIERTLLPEPIDDAQTCSRCYAVDSCMLYRKTIEGEDEIPSRRGLETLQSIYREKTEHITPNHSAFFTKWESLISLEEREIGKFKKEIWELTAENRRAKGRAFANMEIDKSFDDVRWLKTAKRGSSIHRYTYCFMSSISSISSQSPRKSRASSSQVVPTQSLLSGQMGVGDPVVLSIEGEKLGIAKGFICELSPYRIVIGLDHRLENVGAVSIGSMIPKTHKLDDQTPKIFYRIDKDELMAGMGRIRDNIAQLFYTHGDHKRRELVVDLRVPVFEPTPEIIVTDPRFAHLNEDQRDAIHKVMSAKDYALILGMPGTGKTTTIAEVIKVLIKEGKTILLTSYTHSAVDNILAKLIKSDIDMLRLGNVDKISPALHPYTIDESEPMNSVEALEARLITPQLVATTCLSINHPIFKRRKFDYCIVDEASQITLPTCLGPLRYAEVFILVGDHFQLPPLVKNPMAKSKGLEISLFKLLSEEHPSSMVSLTRQYRMNEEIMSLSNSLIYNGQLKCGNEDIANLTLKIPNGINLDFYHSTSPDKESICSRRCWLKDVLSDERKVVFVDTDKIDAQESITGSLVQNKVEAQLVVQIVNALLRGGVPASEIGVITPYRQQIKLLNYLLEHAPTVEIITADKSQGRDKSCIIMTMVRNNENGNVGELLKDWRRINVCLTRSREKLIILGSFKTLKSSEILNEFLNLVEAKQWIYSLESGDQFTHLSLDSSSTTTNLSSDNHSTPRKASRIRPPSSPLDKLSPRLRNIRKTHAVLNEIATHLIFEDE